MFGKDFDDIFRQFEKMMSQFDNRMNSTWKSSNFNLEGWDKETYENEDGSIRVTTFSRGTSPEFKNTDGLTKLKRQLEFAIENEDFELAVKLRDQIKNFESNQSKIDKLESELKQVIKDHNFERAIEIRDELKKLK